jgi:hypothetical protein
LQAEPFAYDQLELTPVQFWAMTPLEYNHLREGYYRRSRRRLEDVAGWVCVLVNHFPMRGKNAKTLRVEQLIGYSPEQQQELDQARLKARANKK